MTTKTETQATARPWSVLELKSGWYVEAQGHSPSSRVTIAQIHETALTRDEPDHAKADADLIVRCVNERDALINERDALMAVVDAARMHGFRDRDFEKTIPTLADFEKTIPTLADFEKTIPTLAGINQRKPNK